MIEADIPNLNAEILLQKIDQEVKKRKETVLDPQLQNQTAIDNNSHHAVELMTEKPFEIKNPYTIGDFIQYDGSSFITNIYKGVLEREPAAQEMQYWFDLLTTGKRSKVEILSAMRFSKEGKRKNIEILGLKKRSYIAVLYRLPIIGYLSKTLVTLLTIPKLLMRLNHYESRMASDRKDALRSSIKNEADINILRESKAGTDLLQQLSLESKRDIAELQQLSRESIVNMDALQNLIDALRQLIRESDVSIDTLGETKADKREFALYMQSVNYAKEYMKMSQKNMQALIDEANKRMPKKLFRKKELQSISEEEKHQFDAFYVEFEDRFRGSRKEIKERLTSYLPYIDALPFKKKRVKILDVGCGRGEWIELLGEHGYAAEGIDLNIIMVNLSQELGLDTKEADVIEYLHSLEDESLSAITGFHIIEHLPFEVLIEMYDESLRVLKPGGVVIFETPNPENLIVGACNFYTDPTHLNPLVPEVTEFIVQSRGFINCEIKRVNPMREIKFIDDDKFSDVNDLLYAVGKEQDYAVIGYKS